MSLLIIFLPLLTAFLMSVSEAKYRKRVTLGGAIVTFFASFSLINDQGLEFLWLPGLEAYFSLQGMGAASVLVPTVALVMIPMILYATQKVERRTYTFVTLLLLMQSGLHGIFLAKDLVLFYLFWEATLIPSVFLLGIWGREGRREAAFKYLLYAVSTSFIMLVAILAVRPLSGAASYRLTDLLAATPQLDPTTQMWLFAAFALAFAVKTPLWPLHSWLPDFNEQNHHSGVADVAGTLYKVGGFGFFAWGLPLFPAAAVAAAPVLMALAAFTAVYGAMIAITQNHMKRFLAFASLSHMGIVGVGVFGLHIAGLNGAVFLIAAQMLSTGALFLLIGMLYDRRGSFDLRDYGGLAKGAPALAAVMLFVIFAAIGVPGLGNFPGEFMSLLGAYQSYPWLGFFATLSVIAAGVYGVNTYQKVYQLEETNGSVEDLKRPEVYVLAPLIAGILWMGIFPGWQMQRIDRQGQVVANQFTAQREQPLEHPLEEAPHGDDDTQEHSVAEVTR